MRNFVLAIALASLAMPAASITWRNSAMACEEMVGNGHGEMTRGENRDRHWDSDRVDHRDWGRDREPDQDRAEDE